MQRVLMVNRLLLLGVTLLSWSLAQADIEDVERRLDVLVRCTKVYDQNERLLYDHDRRAMIRVMDGARKEITKNFDSEDAAKLWNTVSPLPIFDWQKQPESFLTLSDCRKTFKQYDGRLSAGQKVFVDISNFKR